MKRTPTVLASTVRLLQQAGQPFALVGAAALAVHGINRATADVDLLVTFDALDRALWTKLRGSRADVRLGDDDDNLLGCVKVGATAAIPVDLVAPRGRWPRRALERARRVTRIDGVEVPVLTLEDVVLAKVHAGGRRDLQDILQVFDMFPEQADAIIAHVDAEAPYLYGPARRDWPRLRAILQRGQP